MARVWETVLQRYWVGHVPILGHGIPVHSAGTRSLYLGRVQNHRGTNQCFQRLLIHLVAFAKVDGAPQIALRLELKRPAGSSKKAPLANVILTTLLWVSPVQMIPLWDHTGTPRGLEGFFHLHSSSTWDRLA